MIETEPIVVTPTREPLNPLLTVSAARMREGALVYALERMEELVTSLYFDVKKGDSKSTQAALDRVDRHFAHVDESEPTESAPARKLDGWLAYAEACGFRDVAGYLAETHCGDCCAIACSCARCYAEQIFGVDTSPASKSAGHRLWSDLVARQAASKTEPTCIVALSPGQILGSGPGASGA